MVEEEIIGNGQIERKHVQWFNFSTILLFVDVDTVISLNYVQSVGQNINNLFETPQNFCAPFRT